MISIEHPYFWFFILTALVPIALVWYYLSWRKRMVASLASTANAKRQLRIASNTHKWIKWSTLSISLLFASLALINLRMGSGTEKVERNGIDVMIALDVSNSMLAQDMSPDRMQRAKAFVRQFTQLLHNDRVGLVLFAGRAYLQSPLTVDHNAVTMLLQSAHPRMIQSQGTNIAEAITLSMKSFNRAEKKFKTLIIISDGEDHEQSAVDAASEARDEGVLIHTVGVGSPEGSTFIDPNTGSAKLDAEGKEVVTRLNEEALAAISKAGGGTYQLLYNTGNVANTLHANINEMDKRNQGAVVFTEYKSYYQWFLAISLIFLIIHFLLPNSKMYRYAVQ